MTKLSRLAVLLVAVVVGVSLWASIPQRGGSAAPVLIRRGIIPGLARDGAPGTQPTPFPTAALPPSKQAVDIHIKMEMNEAALLPGGTIAIGFRGSVGGMLQSGPPVTYVGAAVIDPHQTDICLWETEHTVYGFEATVSRQTSLFPAKQEVVIDFVGPSWHYNIPCSTDPSAHFRVPAFGERSLPGWLGLILPGRGPNANAIEISTYAGGPDCLHSRGIERGSNEFGKVMIVVDIVTPPCVYDLPPGP